MQGGPSVLWPCSPHPPTHLVPAQGTKGAAAVLQQQQLAPGAQAGGHAAQRRRRVGEHTQAEGVHHCSAGQAVGRWL